MDRPGVMAPPKLYAVPQPRGLMAPHPGTMPPELDLRAVLWSVAVMLGAVELCLEISLP